MNGKHKSNHKSGDTLLKSGIIFFIGTIGVAGLNYLYHLFMGRMLGPAEYGILGSLFAIIYLITNVSQTFTTVTSKYSSEFHSKNTLGKLKRLVYKSLKVISLVGLFLLAIYILISPLIADFLNLDDISGVIIVGFIAYFSVIGSILTGAINGMQKFVWQNFSSFISGALKFSLAIFLVLLGFGVNGALIAILIGSIVGLFASAYPLTKTVNGSNQENFNSKGFYKYFFIVLFAFLLSILFITSDQILVKHFFSSTEAGFYAAAGTIAKMIWFGSGFFVGAIFPKVVALKSKNKDPSVILRKGLSYSGILALIGTAIYFIFPKLVVTILYGKQYLPISNLIGFFGLALGFFCLINIFIFYNFGVEKFKFLWILIFGFIFELTSILLFHSTLNQVVYSVLVSNTLVFFALLIYNRKEVFGR